MYLRLKFMMVAVFFMFTFTQAATVTMTARYGKTGSLAGNLNSVNDMVNGRNICSAANTNANVAPGCDMSHNAGLNDNGTVNDPSDDYYEGDLIVRTNDSFEAIAAYSWNGTAGGAEEQVTITGTLPAGKGFIWDGIPGFCKLPESLLSVDKKTITCFKQDFDTNNVGSFAEDLSFSVKVEGDAVNGSTPGYVAFSIETPSNVNAPSTDTTQTANGTDEDLIIVTASPRWNIDKSGGAGYYTLQYGQTNPITNELGYIIWYNFMIEVDEVAGEVDNPINPSLGNEALFGGSDATVTFTDDLSNISPNAVLATWSDTGCDMTHSNSDEPYAVPNATYPDRSVSAPNAPLAVTCTQSGSNVAVSVEHIDGTLTNAPTKTQTGALLPVNHKIAAIGTIKVFVPLSDVEKGANGVDNGGNGDDGELVTTNCITNFNPLGISNTENFNGTPESEADNCRSLTLYASRGNWSKSYRRGWSDRPSQAQEWGDGTLNWWHPPTDASLVMSGEGTATAGSVWGTYTVYTNAGGTDIAAPAICDVIDIETYTMELLDPNVDDSSTFVDDTKHTVDLNYATTETVPDITVEYAIGYVGTWPPNPNAPAGDTVAKECNATSITWYPDYVAAKAAADIAGTDVSKVRLTAPMLPVQKIMAMRIKHKARTNYFTSGNPIPNKTLLVNYATYKSALTSNQYYANNPYTPKDADQAHTGGYHGDRLIMQGAKVRIVKEMTPTNVSPGSEAKVTLTPSFTVDSPLQQTSTVKIIDLLPNGLSYKNGSTLGTYGAGAVPYGEPTIFAPATDADCNTHAATLVADGKSCGTLNGGTGKESILLWDLGTQTTGTDYGDINFTAIVTIDAPQTTLQNYTQIESPLDSSAPPKRVANANVNNTVPTSLLIVKDVLNPLHEINKGSLLNWMEFKVGVRNGSTNPLSELDIIDILPFTGDGVMGSFTFSPSLTTTVNRNRTPASNFSGMFQFDSMTFDENGVCDATNISYWYTQAAGPLDISPVHASNAIPAGANAWCEGTATGPNGACGFTNTSVTAVRVRGIGMDPSATCYLNLKFATQDNVHDDIYSNTASAKAIGVTNAVLSNTVSAKVYASSIGDTVWFDKNHNGVQDGGVNEPGLKNVTVNLYENNGVLIATTLTDSNGKYTFSNLVSGDYVVEVVPLAGYLVTGQNLGGNSALDSNIATDTNRTDTITLGQNEDRTDIDAGLSTIAISGNVFDDGDGNTNVNGVAISAPSGTQLHATLLNSNGAVVATTPIAADGSYSFSNADGVAINTSYTVILATTANATSPSLPTNWNNTGENINSAGAGNDGAINGIIPVNVGNADIPNIDFGINHKPVANDTSKPVQINPGGNTQVTVPDLNRTDTEDGIPTTLTITTLPNNATLYYNGSPVVAGQVIPNFDNTLLTVDPIDGDQTVVFDYTTTDAAGVVSDTATVTMPFVGLGISGTLFNDGDSDANVNGTPISAPSGTQLYINLVDNTGNVIAVKPLAADGTYSFIGADGVTANTNYTIVLSTTQGTVGQTAPMPDLPANWNNTGENINSVGTGNDAGTPGVITVSLGTVGIPQVDFGINHKPTAEDATEPEQVNLAGNTQYPVPGLNVSDTEDGTPTTVTITTLPDATTGVLYYNGIAVTAGQVISNFDNTLLTVDPVDGSPTMIFTYTTTDAAGVESDPATVTMPFLGDIYVGDKVWMDDNGNGLQDAGENGVAGVNVKLYKDDGTFVGTTDTNSTGEYIFKVQDPGSYYIEFDSAYSYTTQNSGDDALDSDVDPSTFKTEVFTLSDGQIDLSYDAGITPTAHIGDYFWIDENANGIQDAGEEPVVGATVELFDAEGNPVTDANGNHSVITDSNGKYGFDVEPGTYQVKFNLPETGYKGYIFSNANQGDNGVDTDVNNRGFTQTITVGAGNNILTMDAGINCGCANVSTDSSDAQSILSMLAMMFFTLMTALYFVRKEEEQETQNV